MLPPIHNRPQGRAPQGAALVLVLCFAVLVAGLAVAFFSRASTERQASNASANGTKVELLADAALNVIVDDLKEEIINNSTTSGTGSNVLYIPKAGANAVPQRQAAIASGPLANLLRISSHTDAGTRAAALLSTGTSYNGRSVSLPRWNLHYLLPLKTSGTSSSTLGDSTPASAFTAPDWVILTRNGPTASASVRTLSSATNANYAIGRYAYAIYDEGGLLDINSAGYPSSSTGTQSGPKGGLAYADLTQLTDGSGTPLLTQTQIDQIVGWRNYATAQPSGTFPNYTFDTAGAARYQTLAISSSSNPLYVSGSSYNGNTDHTILNRQQLIKLLQSIGSTPAEKINLQNALQYLGTFSREVNGPTFSGTGADTSDYNPPHIFDVKVSGTFTRNDGSIATKGEPLVKNRFPLEKLALLEKMRGIPLGTSTLSASDIDDIARYFGLDPVSDSNGCYRHWSYPTTSPKYKHPDPNGIMSLASVAAQNREPDFFEMLQAALAQGSLGKGNVRGDLLNGSYSLTSSPAFVDPDARVTLQTLRIGANLIDQWDTDNYPTTITATSTGDSVYGIEDLPYLNEFLFRFIGNGSTATSSTYAACIAFELWNPHQLLASNTGTYPAELQISPLNIPSSAALSDYYRIGVIATDSNNTKSYWYYNGTTQQWVTSYPMNRFSNALNQGIIGPFTTTQTDFREPALSSTLVLNTPISLPADSVTSGTSIWSQAVSRGTGSLTLYVSLVYRLQYRDANGTFRTYGTFVGQDNAAATLPGTGYQQFSWIGFNTAAQSSGWYSCPKADPRTYRFGTGYNDNFSASFAGKSLTPSASDIQGPIREILPFSGGNSLPKPYRVDLWAVNDPADPNGGPPATNIAKPYYPDKDNQTRPGDALYSYTAIPSISPLYDASHGGPAARPVILNRPFRSIGELGYVFRDMPWKTLDLFSKYSADAALLDLFSLHGSQPLLAGRLNPNTRQKNVLAALLTGATQASGTASNVTAANATSVANAIIALSSDTAFANRTELVTRLMADSAIGNISTIKTERESVVRALADCANTRTWNLLIDLVTQVGKYPPTATSLDQFIVEGERHYWLHVAIDRYTGRVVDKQLEVVRE